MSSSQNALSVTVAGTPDFGAETLQALYRITGRSTGELRRAVQAGDPVYAAGLFGEDHIKVVPILEQTIAFFDAQGIEYVLHEWVDGDRDEITRELMREILEPDTGAAADSR